MLSEEIKIVKVKDAQTAATTAITTDVIDMSADGGWDGVLFLANFLTAAADNLLKVQQSSDNAVADAFADLAGSEVNAGASDELQWVDIFLPRERYVRGYLTRGTSSATGYTLAMLYRGRNVPFSNVTAGTINGVALVAPAEGTA